MAVEGLPPRGSPNVGRVECLGFDDGYCCAVLHLSELLVASSADCAGIPECVCPAFVVWNDVVWFRAIRASTVFPVESYPASWAVCESAVSVEIEALFAYSFPCSCTSA